MRDIRTNFETRPEEFNGTLNLVRRLANFAPKAALPEQASPLKGAWSRRMRQEFPDLRRHYRRANRLWSGSSFAGSVGRRPVVVLRQYTGQQNRPV
jgi:putative transposase